MNNLFSNPVRTFGLAAAASATAVLIALVTQHRFDMQPCPWCVLQRLIFLAIAAVSLLGMVWRSSNGTIIAALGIDLLATAGMAAALWQHFVAASSTSCNLTLADKIISGSGLDGWAPDVFAPRASCADSAATLAGVPYEFWSLSTYAMLATLAVLVLLSQFRQRSGNRANRA